MSDLVTHTQVSRMQTKFIEKQVPWLAYARERERERERESERERERDSLLSVGY